MFTAVSFIAAALDGAVIVKVAILRIIADVADGFGLLVTMPDRLLCWIGNLSFFEIVGKKGLGPF